MKKYTSSSDIVNFQTILNIFDDNLLIELLWYLKEHKYNEDEKLLFLESFSKVYAYYIKHKLYELKLSKPEAFIRKNIKLLNKTGKINFVRDINEAPGEFTKFEPINHNIQNTGYIKDVNGKYVVTNINPQYRSVCAGLCSSSKEITILFDEVAKRWVNLSNVLIHELVHIEQVGFKVSSHIVNKKFLTKILQEGHAIKKSRRVKPITYDLCDIPFNYNNETRKFELPKKLVANAYVDYSVYRYLYFKLEILLGEDFIDKWATTKNSEHYLSLACEKINNDYGFGTFEKIYKNIQFLILSNVSLYDKNFADVKRSIEGRDVTNNYLKDKTKMSIIKEYNEVNKIINDAKTFKDTYEKQKEYIELGLKYTKMFEGNNVTSKYQEIMDSFTEQNFRRKTLDKKDILEEVLKIKDDYSFFEKLLNLDKEVYNIVLKNPNYLNDAIFELELIMHECLNSKDNFMEYYLYNVANPTYERVVLPFIKDDIGNVKIKNRIFI